jgi:8-oxo-dGTP pyrophosphatase MutT (NUDIX family)
MDRELSAGCVIFRKVGNQVQVVLTRPKGRDAWALPKGLLESNEPAQMAAIREAREETGLTGEIRGKIDTIRYTYTAKWEDPPRRVFKIVTFYLLEATGGDTSDHDWEIESVAWFSFEEAIQLASYRTEKEILRKAEAMVAGSEQ